MYCVYCYETWRGGLFLPEFAYPQHDSSLAEGLNNAITPEEVRRHLPRLHNGRAHGALGMPAELLRYARDLPQHGQPSPPSILAGVLTAFLNHTFTSGRVPVACNPALVTPNLKRGDNLDSTNYRPIAVTEALMWLYAGMLNARLLDYTESNELRPNTQAGFRPGHSVLHQVFTLHHMMQRQQHHGSKLFVCLLDLKGAYDRVSRLLLWQALQRLGVHGTMLTAIQAMHATATVSVRVGGRSGPSLPSRTGVRQGCPLSPTLLACLPMASITSCRDWPSLKGYPWVLSMSSQILPTLIISS